MKKSTIILSVLGLLLIAASALVRFVVVPSASKLPDDLDTTSHYTGTASLLNAAALSSGDVAGAFLTDQPVDMDRHVYVSSSSSDTAVVHDDSTVRVAGQTLEDNHVYALDRGDVTATTSPDDTQVEDAADLTITLPLDPAADDTYKLYDAVTQTATTLEYRGEEERNGRTVYHYETTATGDVKSESLLKTLPPALPSALAPALLPSLPAATQEALAGAGPLPETIALTYTASTTYGIWVDSQLGAPLDVSIDRTVTANTALGSQTLTLLPVLDIDVRTTDDAVNANADEAASTGRLLTIMSVWVPIALLVVGLGLLILAVLRQRKA